MYTGSPETQLAVGMAPTAHILRGARKAVGPHWVNSLHGFGHDQIGSKRAGAVETLLAGTLAAHPSHSAVTGDISLGFPLRQSDAEVFFHTEVGRRLAACGNLFLSSKNN